MINKNNHNSGAAGGNGMQSFTVDYLMDCEVYHEFKKGHEVTCPCCGEVYHLSPEHTFIESLKLELVLKAEGCPYCAKEGLTKEYLEWFIENSKKFQHYDFELDEGVFVKAYRKPYGWKPITKKQLREAWEEKEAA